MIDRRRTLSLVATLVLLVAASPLRAAAPPPPAGIDPQLIAAAQKEGTLTFYGSIYLPQLQEVAARFEQQYGIHVDTLRMESSVLPSRIAIEAKSGQARADVIQEPGFQMELLAHQGLIAKFAPPENDGMTPGTFDPDGYWSSWCVNTETISYNPKLVAAAGIAPPKTWFDFTQPQWRGKFALFNGSYEWYVAMQHAFGKDRADAFLHQLAANGVHMMNSHQIVETMIETGEYMGGVNTYGYSMSHDQAAGKDVVEVNPDPTVIELLAIGMTSASTHPNAAKLFIRWTLTRETQQWFATELGRISARKDVKNNPAVWGPKIRFLISNPADSAHYADAVHDFNAILGPGTTGG